MDKKSKKVPGISSLINAIEKEKEVIPKKLTKGEKTEKKPVKTPEVSEVKSYKDVFLRKNSFEQANTTRIEAGKYDVIKRLSVINKLPVVMVIDNILHQWIQEQKINIEKDLKKYSKF